MSILTVFIDFMLLTILAMAAYGVYQAIVRIWQYVRAHL
jgi:hypothetical protein